MAPQPQSGADVRRTILATTIGNALEYFDFTVYGFLAFIIGKLFFPSFDAAGQLLLAVGTFGAGFVMRPLGGSGRTSVMRGRIADGDAGPLTPANLLRYVLSNPGVSVAIPGARYPSRIRENVGTASMYEVMSEAEQRALEAVAAQLY